MQPSLIVMSGTITESSRQSRTRLLVDPAGPSRLWEPWSHTGTSSARERTSPSQSSSLLTALETTRTSAATEDCLLTLSSTSDMQVGLSQM